MASRCSKVKYRDEIAAKLALVKIQRQDKPGHQESRVYQCERCRKWHTTSKEFREPHS